MAGILDRVDVGGQFRLGELALQDVGDGQHAVQRRADLVAHDRQELGLGAQRRLGLGLGPTQGVGDLRHLLGVAAIGLAGGLQQ